MGNGVRAAPIRGPEWAPPSVDVFAKVLLTRKISPPSGSVAWRGSRPDSLIQVDLQKRPQTGDIARIRPNPDCTDRNQADRVEVASSSLELGHR